MLTKAGNYSFIVPETTGSVRITCENAEVVNIDGSPVEVPPEGLRVQPGQTISWTVSETTRDMEGGFKMHFED